MDGDEQEAAQQHRACQEYMLHGGGGGGGGKEKKTKNGNTPTNPSPTSRSSISSVPEISFPWTPTTASNKKNKKRDNNVYRDWQRHCKSWQIGVQEWLTTDDQLQQVTQSIANLRQRCYVTSQSIASVAPKEHDTKEDPYHSNKDWKMRGYRPHHATLPLSLLQLTLNDVLIQHEKMVGLLRTLLSQLSQHQETIGRRLDTMLRHSLSTWNEEVVVMKEWDEYDDSDRWHNVHQHPLETSRQLYTAMARELYRKQRLAQDWILDTITDAMFYQESNTKDVAMDHYYDGKNETTSMTKVEMERMVDELSPRQCAHRCAKEWSRSSPKSELLPFQLELDRITKSD